MGLGGWIADGPSPTAASLSGGTLVVAWTTSAGAGVVAVAFEPPLVTATATMATTTTMTSPPAAQGHHVHPLLGGAWRAGAGRACLVRLGGGRLGPPRVEVRPDLATSCPNSLIAGRMHHQRNPPETVTTGPRPVAAA